MKTMVEVRHLRYQHTQDGKHGVHLDHLEIGESQTLALLGPSGAGKTTALRLVAGLLRPHSGQIRISGVDVTDLAPERRKVGMVFQQPLLFPFLSVLDNVAFASRAGGQRRTQARADAQYFLDLVGLYDFAARSVHSLSGGQAQRVALARALAARPNILLLDEPFSSLDVYVRAEMQEMLAKLRTCIETTMIFVTHDQREAALLADSVALIKDGEIVQEGSISDLYQYPASTQINRMMGGRNQIRGVARDGFFHSALGSLKLPSHSAAVNGDGSLVFRQESVEVSPGDGVPVRGEAIRGRIIEMRALGARIEVTAAVAGSRIVAEVAAPMPAAIGDEALIRIPLEARWVIKDIEAITPVSTEMEYI